MAFDHSLLHFFVEDALRSYSENVRILDTRNPMKVLLNGRKYAIHISYVHDSGENRDNEDESRIQLSRSNVDVQKSNQEQGYNVAFLGFFPSGDVFVAWDPDHVFSMGFETVGSVYARKSHYVTTLDNGFALRRSLSKGLQTDVSTMALPKAALGFYLENIQTFHQVQSDTDLGRVMNATTELTDTSTHFNTPEQIEIEIPEGTTRVKKTFVSTRTAYVRDPKFSRNVLGAYKGTCAICDRQLNIVQAAHIVPHCHEKCQDVVPNGIALCVEHHTLYDGGLLLPYKNQTLRINENKLTFLEQIGQTKGVKGIKELANGKYNIPQEAALQPKEDFLELGFNIRTGQGS